MDFVFPLLSRLRRKEECDVMSLLLAKYQGQIQLSEFKAVTLASLRSLLPQRPGGVHSQRESAQPGAEVAVFFCFFLWFWQRKIEGFRLLIKPGGF